MIVATIAARNYLAHVRVLASSYVTHHAGQRLVVLVLDDESGTVTGDETFDVVHPSDLGLSSTEFHQMAAIYDVTELATAVKPWLLRTLLERGDGAVMYLDPDIEIFGDLSYLATRAATDSVLLVPHITSPLPRDGRQPREENYLVAGAFNLGFIAVGGGARPFLNWWAERLRWDCLHETGAGLFVDQKWVDLAVHMFPNAVLDEAGLNVAYWNLHERTVAPADDAGYTVHGEPLRFFHFSGFDPGRPAVLTRHLGSGSRLDDAAQPAIGQLCRDYAAQLLKHGYETAAATPYAFDAAGGITLTKTLRRSLRYALMAGTTGCPVDPFDAAERTAFAAWARRSQRAARKAMLARVGPNLRALFGRGLGHQD